MRSQSTLRKSGRRKAKLTGEAELVAKIAFKRASRSELSLEVTGTKAAKLSDCTQLPPELLLQDARDTQLGLLLKAALAAEQIGSHPADRSLARVECPVLGCLECT